MVDRVLGPSAVPIAFFRVLAIPYAHRQRSCFRKHRWRSPIAARRAPRNSDRSEVGSRRPGEGNSFSESATTELPLSMSAALPRPFDMNRAGSRELLRPGGPLSNQNGAEYTFLVFSAGVKNGYRHRVLRSQSPFLTLASVQACSQPRELPVGWDLSDADPMISVLMHTYQGQLSRIARGLQE
jgi:hypothetical protein